MTLFGYPSTHNPSTDSSVACLVVGGGGGVVVVVVVNYNLT